ncbi:methyl-accepting chemotaxis protein [Sphingosinicella terrae]|uniref:methyl-accepting chemotaxis protein n=1 Tax=Sphingosinicella terrae TaxID=2172047 RepID=UPI002547EFF4|nr:methyl-accepting chemotaxis protein [Sphingosinicella terrae]
MTISNRILAGFAAVIVLLALLGGYALMQLSSVRSTVDLIVERDVATVVLVDRVVTSESNMRSTRLSAVIRFFAGQPADDAQRGQWQQHAQAAASALGELRTSVGAYQDAAVSTSRAAVWQRMAASTLEADRLYAELRDNSIAQLDAIRDGDRDAVVARGAAIDRSHEALAAELREVREAADAVIRSGQGVVADTYGQTRGSILAGLLIAVAIALAIAWVIRRSITAPMTDFMGFVGRVGQGDLTGATAATGRDELGQLGATLNAMVDGLRDLARQSRQATENLNAAATEIRASTQEQAASVEEQLAAVQETAATVDEITHSGAQISRRAQEVIAAAQAAVQTSESGISAVDDTARAMDGIREQAEAVANNIVALSEKTQAIGDIIATVNDVSERSHLLALNASIEAAAAGENGRSFAIVASEMKTLADQAKAATRNVRSILGDIQRGINASVMLTEEAVKRVTSGKERTDASQVAIEELAARVQESVQTFQQIVASTNQQQIGIEQVTVALQNIRQASQQTAASTRQLDQAAADLTSLSGTLLGLAERYRI